MSQQALTEIVRALLLAADAPLSLSRMLDLLREARNVDRAELREAVDALQQELEPSSLELVEVASGLRIQVCESYTPWIRKLWQEKPQKYSRALLETLALICYRQPLTRGDIEEIRGVSLSANILKTLLERGWIQEVGHREGPGRPALLATTRQFLDDFNLRSLDQLPPLPDLDDPQRLHAALEALDIDMEGLVAPTEEEAQTLQPGESSAVGPSDAAHPGPSAQPLSPKTAPAEPGRVEPVVSDDASQPVPSDAAEESPKHEP